MAPLLRKLRGARTTRLLSLALVMGLLWVGMQHARYLCHAGMEEQRVAEGQGSAHQGGCHDAAEPVSAPADDPPSVPPCCTTGVLVAALPSGKSLTLATTALVLKDVFAVVPVSINPPSLPPPAYRKSLARSNPGESPFFGLRQHLAHQTLLI